jgi:proteasome assembly chaperone (PAC2) family protein
MENLTEETTLLSPKGTFPAQIVNIINPYQLVMNRGDRNGIKVGRRVLIYGISKEEIIDPNTGESLGYLEIVKGTGRVINVQDNMSTIESDQKKIIRRKFDNSNPFYLASPKEKAEILEYDEPKPFENPVIGDLVKPI